MIAPALMMVIALWGSIVTMGYRAWRHINLGSIGGYTHYDADWDPSPSIIICPGNGRHSCKQASPSECKDEETFGLLHLYLQWLLGSCSAMTEW